MMVGLQVLRTARRVAGFGARVEAVEYLRPGLQVEAQPGEVVGL